VRTGAGFVKRAYWKGYEDNLTGLSGMVAYNLLLSVLPLALVALFLAGPVLGSSGLEDSVLRDLRELFPTAADRTLEGALDKVQGFHGRIGIAALVASVWIGSSFWGALDTAFCRIYHVECRGWLRQKGFALVMLVVVLAFFLATIAVPTLQSILIEGASRLPFGLAHVGGLVFAATLAAGLLLLFAILCLIYWTVPNEPMPWAAVWPGALGATVSISLVDYAFPFYLSNVNTVSRIGTTLVFVLIVLIWFYVLAIIILGGAIVNALRFEDLDYQAPAAAVASDELA
jgi:YihY family inner membrane protein